MLTIWKTILLRRALPCAIAVVCAASGVVFGQQRQGDFRTDVELVSLHIAVIAPGGGVVPPLTPEDFTVYDDGREQEIELFVAPSDAPLDIGLLLDSSGSMTPVEAAARRAATTFLRRMAPDDCVYVLPFASKVGAGRWGRSGDPELHGFIGAIETGGGTSMYDALLEGLSALERAEANQLVAVANAAREDSDEDRPTPAEPPSTGTVRRPPIDLPPRHIDLGSEAGIAIHDLDLHDPPPARGCGEPLPPGATAGASNARRRALVLVSDGADVDSRATHYEALGAARAASVPIFTVAMGAANNDPRLKAELAELARATGGRLVENTRPGELPASYDEIVKLLRSFYLIGYNPGFPARDGEGAGRPPRVRWHEVRVELRRPTLEALVRPGYYR